MTKRRPAAFPGAAVSIPLWDGRDVVVEHPAGSDLHYNEDVEGAEGDGDH
jgi:hypothetical protein